MSAGRARRIRAVWLRNWTVYRQTWQINFVPPLLEPLFYLLAFGVGLAALVGNVSYGGVSVPYVAYIAPALVAINIMNSAFFENTYASFVRMFYQKTFDAMLATPLSLPEIICGEIFWGASKAAFGTTVMLTVISAFGLLRYPQALLLIPLALLGGLAFGSIAMLFTALVPNIESFNLPIFLFITPMFLFSGTFFPVANLPDWAQTLALFLPLTHLVNLARAIGFGALESGLLWPLAYLLLFSLIVMPLAVRGMTRRLIR